MTAPIIWEDDFSTNHFALGDYAVWSPPEYGAAGTELPTGLQLKGKNNAQVSSFVSWLNENDLTATVSQAPVAVEAHLTFESLAPAPASDGTYWWPDATPAGSLNMAPADQPGPTFPAGQYAYAAVGIAYNRRVRMAVSALLVNDAASAAALGMQPGVPHLAMSIADYFGGVGTAITEGHTLIGAPIEVGVGNPVRLQITHSDGRVVAEGAGTSMVITDVDVHTILANWYGIFYDPNSPPDDFANDQNDWPVWPPAAGAVDVYGQIDVDSSNTRLYEWGFSVTFSTPTTVAGAPGQAGAILRPRSVKSSQGAGFS